MDKNVSSVNLDELKAAREALDRERGVETDPNMYNDYDPEKHKAEREQEKLARENASNGEDIDVSSIDNNEESIVSDTEQTLNLNNDVNGVDDSDNSDELNLNIYDTFSDFEVNSGTEVGVNSENAETDSEEDTEVNEDFIEDEESENSENDLEEVNISEKSVSSENSSLDDFLDDLDAILSDDSSEDDEEIIVENEESESDNEYESNSVEDLSDGKQLFDKDEDTEKTQDINDEVEKFEDIEDVTLKSENYEENKELDDLDISENTNNKESSNDSLDIFAFSNYENLVDEEPSMNSVENEFNTEVLSDFSKLSTMSDEMEAELNSISQVENKVIEKKEETEESEIVEDDEADLEEPENVYPTIEPYNFIDVMGTDDFKESDNFSYLIGKNESGELIFGNLKDACGTAVFARNEEVIFSSFSSILLSLLLKNTPDEMQFVLCDAMFDSDFDVFENSSYMYFNRVAKNNREIVDTLVELSKEIENRYNNLVYAGVKTISSFNAQAEERGTGKMPYVVLFINNYAKMTQFLDNERINICLYNILKFGRIVGVYVVLASASEIERRDINYNLPTRIAYKTENEFESVKAVGFEGAESLTDEKDFLYSTIYEESAMHLKVADLTKKEIELIIENLEN